MSIKILLADDSITIQKVVGIIFGGEEYALTVVDNGKSAVEKARELNPDVLLIDALMPGMSGYEVCETVRAIPTLAGKPILLLTGAFEPLDEDRAKSCGADDFLAKPFESQQIITKVKELFEKGSTRTSAHQPEAEAFSTPTYSEPANTSNAQPITEESPEANDIWGAFTTPEVTLEETAAESVPVDSQWTPVEEETFEFKEETVTTLSTSDVPKTTVEESMFGGTAFATPSQPSAVSATLTEDQLRTAIAGVSKEVVERIVWEVVPDLAEALIKEAIRKIKEGK